MLVEVSARLPSQETERCHLGGQIRGVCQLARVMDWNNSGAGRIETPGCIEMTEGIYWSKAKRMSSIQ